MFIIARKWHPERVSIRAHCIISLVPRHWSICVMLSGDRHYSCKLSQKDELDTTWILCLCKIKSHGQARFKYNGLEKKCTFTATKNGNDSTIDQYGLLLVCVYKIVSHPLHDGYMANKPLPWYSGDDLHTTATYNASK